ncbi:uncharacterized protein LOC107366073 [Tetranychus urticae]|uniref:Uncharacterized protein n=1 Tax=Tetranychus urticae TaxID=32264 RepID=T1KPJ9_TETUR|nr:uncharacterized protein LOC107366073 [Tetranychus urticae]
MNFLIILSAIFCLSPISAAPTEGPTPLAKAAVEFNRRFVNEWEQMVPGWDSKASLQSNLMALLSRPFDNNMVPAWNPDISAKENFEKYIVLLDVEGLARNKSVVDNMALIVQKYFNKLPIPMFFPKSEIEEKIVDEMTTFVTEHFDHNIKTETLDQAVNAWLDSLDIKISDPKDFIKSTLETIFAQISFPGFSSDKTLQDNVVGLTEFIFQKIDF